MRAYLTTEFKRAFGSPYFVLSLLICLGIYAVGEGYLGWVNIILYPSATWVHEHNGFMMEFNPFRSLLPFPAALAAGHLLVDDWRHRNLYFQISRSNFSSFCFIKFMVPCVMGGIVLGISVLCYLGLMASFVPAFDDSTDYEPFVESFLLNGQWGLYFLYFGSLQFLLGAACAGISCATATLTDRKSVVCLIPMLSFAMLEIITNITIVGLSGGQSAIVFRLQDQSALHVYCVIAGILLALISGTYVAFRMLLRKRVFIWQ